MAGEMLLGDLKTVKKNTLPVVWGYCVVDLSIVVHQSNVRSFAVKGKELLFSGPETFNEQVAGTSE